MDIAGRMRSGCCLAVLLAIGLGGCVGLVRTRLDWAPVTSDVRTRTEVLARFGEPLRKAQEGAREVWYYALSGAPRAGWRPATEGSTILYALVTPVWWRTRPDENARFAFDGDALAAAAELRASEAGFFCGFNLAADRLVLCGPVP